MRQVFSSARLENVEGVARLLNDHGIATTIRNGRSYHGGYGKRFSYRHAPEGVQPSVWVIHSDDQPKARQLLRDAGLADTTRPEARGSFAASPYAATGHSATPAKALFSPKKLRMVLVIGIGIVMAMTAWWQMKQPPTNAPAVDIARRWPATSAPAGLPSAAVNPVYQADVPTALAKLLFARIGTAQGITRACLQVDGKAVTADFIAQPAPSACDGHNVRIEISEYRTDGSGIGSVQARWQQADGGAGRAAFQVQREGYDWRVLRELP